eukprot:COSAG01_NODE_68_length_28978_cov_182.027777_33_plen_96_part_00
MLDLWPSLNVRAATEAAYRSTGCAERGGCAAGSPWWRLLRVVAFFHNSWRFLREAARAPEQLISYNEFVNAITVIPGLEVPDCVPNSSCTTSRLV